MVDVSFEIVCLDGTIVKPSKVTGYEINKELNAPCDSLRLYFLNNDFDKEIVQIKAKKDNNLIFDGYVDVQKDVVNKNGTTTYVFARSKASRLTDNEALPRIYYSPNTDTICQLNIDGLGLENHLPVLNSDTEYQVTKGTSCYKAIDDFVYSICGKHIYVTCDGCVKILDSFGRVNLDNCKVLNASRIVNRGSALAEIRYKINNADSFNRHRESGMLKERGIVRSCYKNLTNTPDWQRDTRLSNIMQASNDGYFAYRFELLGYVDASLLDKLVGNLNIVGKVEKTKVVGISHILDKNGERTIICANKQLDFEEVSYVD